MISLSSSPESRLARTLVSLEGLSVGDAFGERFFLHPAMVKLLMGERVLPAPPWHFTDDTQMALSIVAILRQHDGIDQDRLADHFGWHYDISRGYGPAMHRLLPLIRSGTGWQQAARDLFGGQGSYGNGSAMRVAPLGAYFADDLDAAVEHARRSAEVTRAHPAGIAGAIAVALAAAHACRLLDEGGSILVPDLLDRVIPYIPESNVRVRTKRARDLPLDVTVQHAAATLGNGERVTAQDTVPFTLWCAARHLHNYEEALWATVSVLGDLDTTCAIVACATGVEGIPADWHAAREPLPNWRD